MRCNSVCIYSIWTLHIIFLHNVPLWRVHFGSSCIWFYLISKIGCEHWTLYSLCTALILYAHIYEHCFNYAMHKSVSWDIVKWNVLRFPLSLTLFHPIWLFLLFVNATSATIQHKHEQKQQSKKKDEFALHNFSDTLHFNQCVPYLRPIELEHQFFGGLKFKSHHRKKADHLLIWVVWI